MQSYRSREAVFVKEELDCEMDWIDGRLTGPYMVTISIKIVETFDDSEYLYQVSTWC